MIMMLATWLHWVFSSTPVITSEMLYMTWPCILLGHASQDRKGGFSIGILSFSCLVFNFVSHANFACCGMVQRKLSCFVEMWAVDSLVWSSEGQLALTLLSDVHPLFLFKHAAQEYVRAPIFELKSKLHLGNWCHSIIWSTCFQKFLETILPHWHSNVWPEQYYTAGQCSLAIVVEIVCFDLMDQTWWYLTGCLVNLMMLQNVCTWQTYPPLLFSCMPFEQSVLTFEITL